MKSEINQWIAKDIGDVNYIFHLAAGSHVDQSILNPIRFIYDNVVGTGNILEFIRKIKRKKYWRGLYILAQMKFLVLLQQE